MRTDGNPAAPLLIQVAANGDRTKADHPAVPVSIDELVRDAVACVAAGAGAIHLHPRDSDGRECLDPLIVDHVVNRIRAATGVPVGVTTEAGILPDVARRLALVSAWRAPDYASVNLCEEGSVDVMRALLASGIGIEAGVWSVDDAELLAASGLAGRITRVLVEPGEAQVGGDPEAALALVGAIHDVLDRHGITAPRLQHGDGRVTWVLLADAVYRGLATRIGFEDTLDGPNGEWAMDNAALVRAAVRLRDGAGSGHGLPK